MIENPRLFIFDDDPSISAQCFTNRHLVREIYALGRFYSQFIGSFDWKVKNNPKLLLQKRPKLYFQYRVEIVELNKTTKYIINNLQTKILEELKSLLKEYEYRFGRKHRVSEALPSFEKFEYFKLRGTSYLNFNKLKVSLENRPVNIPNDYKTNDPIESHKRYYRAEFQKANFGKRGKPDWL